MTDPVDFNQSQDFPSPVIQLRDDKDQKRIITKLFRMWSKRLLRSAAAHYMAAEKYESRDLFLTQFNIIAAISVLFFSSNQIVAQRIFEFIYSSFSTDNLDYESYQMVVPFLSLLVVLSSAIQYIMQYSRRAYEHKQAGNEFSNLRRKIERYWSKGSIHIEAVHSLNRSYNSAVRNPPLIPKSIWADSLKIKMEEIEKINRFYYNFDADEDLLGDSSCP
jgi:hypothetical protein